MDIRPRAKDDDMSQTTDPIPPPPPSAPVEQAEPPKRRGGLVAVAIGIAVVLLAGVAVFALTRSDTAEAQPLALAFEQGQSQTYEIEQTMDAEISSDVFGSQSVSMDVSQVVGWEVTSVDEEGVATIEVSVSEMSGSVNGQEIPESELGTVPPVEIEIAPDGRVISAGGLALGGAGQTQGFGFPGMGQLTPILPDEGEEVSVGDTWEKEFSQDFPFGEGTIEFSATSTYERDEDVNGRTAAVIVSDLTVPLDFTLSFADLLETLGPELAGATGAGQLDALADASIAYGGEGAFTQTSFVDLQAKELLRTQSEGTFDITMEFSGVPGLESSGTIDFTGTFTQDLELQA
jgi:hypothetical protein